MFARIKKAIARRFKRRPIDKFIERIDYEIKLGYYDNFMLRTVKKWAKQEAS